MDKNNYNKINAINIKLKSFILGHVCINNALGISIKCPNLT